MTYDLLIKNGRIIDGSGSQAFRGDIGVRNGRIAQIGKLRDGAKRTIDAQGMAVTPGFIDTHCHYDAQAVWDPLCEFSCYHGATTVIVGNCSLALAPVRPGGSERLAEFLSYVEAIPMETLRTVKTNWESISEYMDVLDQRLGVNVGNLIGHTAVRHYVMGDESQGRPATPDEIEQMRTVVRDGMSAGALGLSIDRTRGHYDSKGVNIPAYWAQEDEIFGLADVLGEMGTGIIQSGMGREAEFKNKLMSRLAEKTGRTVVYNSLRQSIRQPDAWKDHVALVDEAVSAGLRAYPMCTPNTTVDRFTMRNAQIFRGIPTWHPILLAPLEEKRRAYSDPEVRRKLHEEVVEWKQELRNTATEFGRNWYEKLWVDKVVLDRNKAFEGKTIREISQMTGKGIIDSLLDLAVEEDLNTVFVMGASKTDNEATIAILNYPNAYIGLSDGGAHVHYHGGYGYSSKLLGYWVREEGIMSLEQAVRRLTFDNTSLFGMYDRGLLQPGQAADIVIFDPDTIDVLPEEVVHDLPGGAWRLRELAKGMHYTIVNGHVLIEEGRHTGALPGRVMRNSWYRERHRS